MSRYPAAAAGQGLYEASLTQKAELGAVHAFEGTYGPVWAQYVKNNNAASIAAGFPVGLAWDVDADPWAVDTAAVANSLGPVLGGVICASMQGTATSLGGGGYGWMAFRGPITNLQLAASLDSNVVSYVTVNASALGALLGSAGTMGSAAHYARIIGIVGATASNISRASNAGASGSFVNLFIK
jgi:hypothetical protein